MKAHIVSSWFRTGGVALLVWAAQAGQAQDATNSPTPAAQTTATAAAAMPALSYGAEEILQLARGKVSADTMRSFVENSHLNYDLDAPAILYLRQEGVPDPVLTAMLEQSKRVTGASTTPAATVTAANAVTVPAYPAPAVTYSQPLPDYTTTYPVYTEPVIPYDYYDYYPYYVYPYYPMGFSGRYGHYYSHYYGGGIRNEGFRSSGTVVVTPRGGTYRGNDRLGHFR